MHGVALRVAHPRRGPNAAPHATPLLSPWPLPALALTMSLTLALTLTLSLTLTPTLGRYLREAIRPEQVGSLVRHHRDLQVRPSLLVRSREVDVGVGRPVRTSQIPLTSLSARVLRL